MKLEEVPVTIRFFRPGSVEDVQTMEDAGNLAAAEALVFARFPKAVFTRCCQHEEDGGCVFVYPSELDQQQDEDQMLQTRGGPTPADYGRWIGLITSAGGDEPKCSQPSPPD